MITQIQNILTRVMNYTGSGMVPPKGSALNYPEEDNNFFLIFQALLELNGSANISPYDPSTTYSNSPPQYVSHGGNIWLYINASPSSGNTPPTPPALSPYWELTSIGALAHVQNTDLYLNFGGPNQVSAVELRTLLNNQVILTTRAAFNTLVSTSALRGGYLYLLSDVAIALRSITSNRFDRNGHLFVDYTGAGLRGTLEIERVNYDPVADVIFERHDNYGNVVKNSVASASSWINNAPWGVANFMANEIIDCTLSAAFPPALVGQFKRNRLSGTAFTNNISVLFNTFLDNEFTKSLVTFDRFSQIETYRCVNSIFGISGAGSSVFGGETLKTTRTVTGGISIGLFNKVPIFLSLASGPGEVSKNFSSLQETIVITGTTLDANGTHLKDAAGIFIMDAAVTGAQVIDTINLSSWNYFHEVMVKLHNAMTLTINAGGNIYLPGALGGTLALDGAAGDWFKFIQSDTGQFQIIQYFQS